MRAVGVVAGLMGALAAFGAGRQSLGTTGLSIDAPFPVVQVESPVEEADSDQLDGSDRFAGSAERIRVWVRAYRGIARQWPAEPPRDQRVLAALNGFRAETGLESGKIESNAPREVSGVPGDRAVLSGEVDGEQVRARVTVVTLGFRTWSVLVRNIGPDPAVDAVAARIADSVQLDPRLIAAAGAAWFDAADGRVQLQTPARLARDERAVPATLPEPLSAVFVYRGLANEVLIDLVVNVHKEEVGVNLISAAEAAAKSVRGQDPAAVVRLGGTRMGGAVAARVDGTFQTGGRKFGFVRLFFTTGDCDGRIILIWPDGNADAAAWAEYTVQGLKPGPKASG